MRGMIKKLKMERHSDKTINVSLYYLRARIIRDHLDGLEHVEALMRLRGLDLDAVKVPKIRNKRYGNGELQRAVLELLSRAPLTVQGMAHELDHPWRSITPTLRALEARGVVRREGRVWRLAP